MRLALIRLADREHPAQQFDRFLQAMGFFNNLVVGLPLQLLRDLRCFIYAMRHAWSSGGTPAGTHANSNRAPYQPACPFFTVVNGYLVAGAGKRPEVARSYLSGMCAFTAGLELPAWWRTAATVC